MQKFMDLFGVRSLIVIGTVFLSLLFLFFTKRLLWKILKKAAAQTAAQWDDELLVQLNNPVRVLIVFGSLAIGLHMFPELVQEHPLLRVLPQVGFIVIATWAINRSIVVLLKAFLNLRKVALGTQQFVSATVQFLVCTLGLLGILDTLGLSITPILASLGVGSLAVALALQDTLGNLFAGIYLFFDQPIRVGDYVRLEDGSEGFIVKIGWRSTQIRMLSDNIIVIPNSKISNSQITNFDLLLKETSVVFPIGVSYGSDLAKVERVTLETVKEVIKKVPGAVTAFEPVIYFTTFADSSINFNLVVRVQHWTHQALLKHEIIKALHNRYNAENIEIPFPQRVIHLQKEGAPVV